MESVKVVYVVRMTEHERGWGQRPDGYLGFRDEAMADRYLAEIHEERMSHMEVPDEYTPYEKIGYKAVSDAMFDAAVHNKHTYFDTLSELQHTEEERLLKYRKRV